MHSVAETKSNIVLKNKTKQKHFLFDYLLLPIWNEQFYIYYFVSIVRRVIAPFVPQNKIVLVFQFGWPFGTTPLWSR